MTRRCQTCQWRGLDLVENSSKVPRPKHSYQRATAVLQLSCRAEPSSSLDCLEEAMNQNIGVYGRKLGNTQFFSEDGSVVRVTVIEAGPCIVVDKRTPERDKYSALVIGLGERKEKHTNKAQLAVVKKAGTTPKRTIREIRVPADVA